jgi:hypothetical protein
MIDGPDSENSHIGPVWLRTTHATGEGSDWLRIAMAQLAEDAARFYFNSGGTMILELHSSHGDDLQQLASGWPHFSIGFSESPRELHIMLPFGRATVLFTWPDAGSISLLEPTRAGRRLVLRLAHLRAIDGGKTE